LKLLLCAFPVSVPLNFYHNIIPNLVLAKSNGYTTIILQDPAIPPAIMFPKKNFNGFSLALYGLNTELTLSLIAKFNAVVGKYLLFIKYFT
jgi:hypothetical protein